MNVEQILTDELGVVAASVEAPPPPAAAELIEKAERARTRTLLTRLGGSALVAAAVVAAIVIGTQVGDPDATPSPAPQPSELSTGAPPRIPFVKNDKLYVDGQVQRGSWLGVVTVQAASVGYLDDANDLTGSVALFHNGSEIARVPNVSVQGVVLSPDGSKAAWVERTGGGTWYVVSFDLEAGHELGRVAVDRNVLGHVGQESEAWESVSAVDNAGEVTWGGVVRQHLWKPGGVPEVSAPDPNPGATSGEFPVDEGIVSLSPDGAWGAWTVDHTGDQLQGTSATPDQYDVEVMAQRPGQPASLIHFGLPRNTNASGISWETTGGFLVTVFDDPTGISWHYLRCTIATRECEVAPTPYAP
jgi:hypothetical protein